MAVELDPGSSTVAVVKAALEVRAPLRPAAFPPLCAIVWHCCASLAADHLNPTLTKQRQDRTGIPAPEQLLTHGGRPLAALPSALSTLDLSLRLAGGKGGFGALLRGQGRDGKITDNFDACRDLQGRRVRQVEAEKKLKEWAGQAKERELEKVAERHIRDLARQQRQEQDYEVRAVGLGVGVRLRRGTRLLLLMRSREAVVRRSIASKVLSPSAPSSLFQPTTNTPNPPDQRRGGPQRAARRPGARPRGGAVGAGRGAGRRQ